DVQPAGGDLPVRNEPLRQLGASGLGRSAADHPHGAGTEHPCSRVFPRENLPLASHPNSPRKNMSEAAGQALKTAIQIRNLNFYYGKFLALKDNNLDIVEHKV